MERTPQQKQDFLQRVLSMQATLDAVLDAPVIAADTAYQFFICSKCGQPWQNIDFQCARHQLTCGYPLPPKAETITPRADDPDSGYDPDCCACLRGRVHSRADHDAKIRRAQGIYAVEPQGSTEWDESACMGSRD